MRPPKFWEAEVSGRDAVPVLRMLLAPVSWGYAWAAAHRQRTTITRHAPIPVVCIGNFTVGGAGKTPITRAIRAKLGEHAHTLSRGYGGRIAGPLRVTPDMDAREVGDEPLLHARDGAAWIARDRLAGALAAAQAGARAIVMDDGFQNPTLGKDLSIVVVDAAFGVGNGKVFPSGPLRERLADGLARADAIVLLNSPLPLGGGVGVGGHQDDAQTSDLERDTNPASSENGGAQPFAPHPYPSPKGEGMLWLSSFNKPVLRATLEPTGSVPSGKLIAFAGLARPEKFFDTLTALGAELDDALPFADHHVYSEDDLGALAQMAEERGAALITTEKDAARLSPAWRGRVSVLPVAARFDDEAQLDALLAPIRARM